jgi:Uma2 family endonuclease
MAPIGDVHQDLGRWLIALFACYVDLHELGAVRYEPFQMKTGPDLHGRAPDILFVAKKNLSRMKKNHLEGPADLVIEIIGPGSGAIDCGDKYYEYEKGGVKEYWLLDPRRRQAEFYKRGRDGIFRLERHLSQRRPQRIMAGGGMALAKAAAPDASHLAEVVQGQVAVRVTSPFLARTHRARVAAPWARRRFR